MFSLRIATYIDSKKTISYALYLCTYRYFLRNLRICGNGMVHIYCAVVQVQSLPNFPQTDAASEIGTKKGCNCLISNPSKTV